MARNGNLTPLGLTFKAKSFSAKKEAIITALRKHTALGVTMRSQNFIAKQAEVVTTGQGFYIPTFRRRIRRV